MDRIILRTIICKVEITTWSVFLGQLRPIVKYQFNYSFLGRGLLISTFGKLTDTFTKPLIIQFGQPCFKWFIPAHIRCLNIFYAPTVNNQGIYIHLHFFFLYCQSYSIRRSPDLRFAWRTKRYITLVLPR